MKLLVTGATGYIGKRLVAYAVSEGHEVTIASRKRLNLNLPWISYDLNSTSEFKIPCGTTAVIHLAAITNSTSANPASEIESARRLIDSSEKAKARIIFISSQTACSSATSDYGRTKWEIEKLVIAAGGQVLRPGQVYGGPEDGLFGMLVRFVRRSPVIPAFFPAPKVQPVHLDDLLVALLHCAELNNQSRSVYCIGSPSPVSFNRFLTSIASRRVRRFRFSLPIPVVLIHIISKVLGRELSAKVGLNRLTSLLTLPMMETSDDLRKLNVVLRQMDCGMTRSGQARRFNLIQEARSFLEYILKEKPSGALVRRYVRCIEHLKGGQPLYLPRFLHHAPFAIALLDGTGPLSPTFNIELGWRLNAAVALAEASPQGGRRFLLIEKPSGFFLSSCLVVQAISSHVFWRVAARFFNPILKLARLKSGDPQ